MRTAFKEWAVVVDALGRGDQIIILRKGGISEGRSGFQPEHPEFLLFPTLFHQQRDLVIESAQRRYDAIVPDLPTAEHVVLKYWARLEESRQLADYAAAASLTGQHIWKPGVIRDRFEWGK